MSDNYIPIDTNLEVQSGFAFPSTCFVKNGVPIVRMSDLKTGKLIFYNTKYVSDKWLKTASPFVLKSGDFLMGMSGSLTNYAVVSDDDIPALLNQRVGRLKLKNSTVNYDYACYWLKSKKYACYAEIQGEGAAQKNISAKQIGQFHYRDVHILKQNKIVSILQAIDQAIEKTEALIEKYQQIKVGLMHDLFTRGITADGKLRLPREQAPELYQETSIGWIPEDWKIIALGEVSDIASGVTLNSKMSPDQTVTVPYLRVANVQDGYLDLQEVKEVLVNQSMFLNLLLQPGDVLMNEGGDFDKLGRGTVWEGEIEPCIHQNHVFRVRTNKEILHPYYLAFWSESSYGKKYFILSSKQSTNLASINSTQLKAYPIALPCLEEQQRIENRINAVNSRINSLRKKSQKLDYQKSGLMHDLLTGAVPVTINDGDTND